MCDEEKKDSPLRTSAYLVVGASSGIGREIAIQLARAGGRVVLVARNREKLDSVCAELPGDAHGAEPFDVANFEAIPDWMKSVAQKYGTFHGLVSCAGQFTMSPIRVLDAKQADAVWRVNVFANLWLGKGFRQRGVVHLDGGSLVYITSVVSLIGQAGLSVYSASKGAITAMARTMAMELAREKIRVNCIAPSNLKTAMTDVTGPTPSPEEYAAIEKEHPLGFGEPRDVAGAALYLLSPASRWVTGTTMVVDGGYSAH